MIPVGKYDLLWLAWIESGWQNLKSLSAISPQFMRKTILESDWKIKNHGDVQKIWQSYVGRPDWRSKTLPRFHKSAAKLQRRKKGFGKWLVSYWFYSGADRNRTDGLLNAIPFGKGCLSYWNLGNLLFSLSIQKVGSLPSFPPFTAFIPFQAKNHPYVPHEVPHGSFVLKKKSGRPPLSIILIKPPF